VIVPVYNTGKYLAPCLDSILAQTLKEIEVVCVDDGSTDGSPALLDEYAARDPRVVVVHQANGGTSAARNAGLERASAPYIGFVEHDDWIEPETYETALAKMLADEEIDFVSWGFDYVDEAGDRLPKKRQREARAGSERFSGKSAVNRTAVFLKADHLIWHQLYKNSLIRTRQVTFPLGLVHEDDAFTLKYLAWARYGFFSERLFYHHRSWPSVSGKAWTSERSKAFYYLEVVRDVLEYYRRHELLSDKGRLLARRVSSVIGLGYNASCAKEEYLRRTRRVLSEFDLPDSADSGYQAWRRGQDPGPEYTWLEKIFSSKNWGPHKVLRFLGLELKFPRRNHSRR
jgi:heptose III glucuronosyltransferase